MSVKSPFRLGLVGFFMCTAFVAASHSHTTHPFDSFFAQPQVSNNTSSTAPAVDLGYERYQGVADATTGLDTFKGIRFAAPPTGSMRWQAPAAPKINRHRLLPANALPPRCPQTSAPAPPYIDYTGDEDCLFLSVYAPQNKSNLPVLVWIHGGGYGVGQGNQDLSRIINTNNNSFVGVVIQYRLGAFGFLSSDELQRRGVVNAGILDQTFALQWVQTYIHLFGGNASQVTISGESAGAGAVMLQTLAFGGNLGDSLFVNAIAASPYLPQQYGYADFVPTQSYYAFASAVGCFNGLPRGDFNNSIFDCLISKDTGTLQTANFNLSGSGRFNTSPFLPVTDGSIIQQAYALGGKPIGHEQRCNANASVQNNANEGPLFAPQNIESEDDLVNFLRNSFPLFTEDDISRVLLVYPADASVSAKTPKFATSGSSGPTAVDVSTFATGQQQRAHNIYAETTFVCPSYWLAEAFTNNDRVAYKYQYSVIPAQHGVDVNAFFGPPLPEHGPDYVKALMTSWGNFITGNNPSIPANIAVGVNGISTNGASNSSLASTEPVADEPNAASNWPPYTLAAPYQLNLNQSGGIPISASPYPGFPRLQLSNVTYLVDPGLKNNLTLVNAYTWEGGRGMRCDFWRSIGRIVPG
ncbi:MAG: hypothetical protein Q9224_002031 [Gallowayella concinna]